jgi:hypothetical protein
MGADNIVIETIKTGTVTVVVVVMSIFSKKRCKLYSANLGNDKLSRQKAESADFLEENSHRPRNISQKRRKGQIPKKLASEMKKLDLNSTDLE